MPRTKNSYIDTKTKDGGCSPHITDPKLVEYLRLICKRKDINLGVYCEEAIRKQVIADLTSDSDLVETMVRNALNAPSTEKEEQIVWH